MAGREAYVLVVDDDPLILGLIAARLEGGGYNVTTASDAWQEVLQAQGLKIGLVVTDINMPGAGTGLDAYRHLRRVFPQLPVIFVSAMPREEIAKQLPPDPRVRVLSKPIDFELLRAAIKELTGVDRPL
ncbi:MAG: response regulator [Elusimicrobia bacterium]|nr:response regulator [Elusimicrobiota bacterium]MDE2314430.1 response regulator [Elusimicrobiota bacterium]